MGGVVGWWDEPSDPEVSDALDELAGQGLGEKSPFKDDKLPELAARMEKHVEADQVKISLAPVGTKAPTYTKASGWVTLGGTINVASTNSTTMVLDYVNLTRDAHHRLLAYEQAFKAVNAALELLVPKVMGLPSKEYKTVKPQLELVAKVMADAKKKGLI